MDLILFRPHAASFLSYLCYGNSITFALMQRLLLIVIWMQKLSPLLHFLVKTPAAAAWAAGPALHFSSTLFNLFVLFPLRSRTLPLFQALSVTPNPDQPTLHCSSSGTTRRQRGFIPSLYLDVSQDPSIQWCR